MVLLVPGDRNQLLFLTEHQAVSHSLLSKMWVASLVSEGKKKHKRKVQRNQHFTLDVREKANPSRTKSSSHHQAHLCFWPEENSPQPCSVPGTEEKVCLLNPLKRNFLMRRHVQAISGGHPSHGDTPRAFEQINLG